MIRADGQRASFQLRARPGGQRGDSNGGAHNATLMRHPGGTVVAGLIGLALISAGVFLAYQAWEKEFLKHLRFGRRRPA